MHSAHNDVHEESLSWGNTHGLGSTGGVGDSIYRAWGSGGGGADLLIREGKMGEFRAAGRGGNGREEGKEGIDV